MSLLHSTRDIGRIGERIAARYLRRHGFRILEKNRHQGRNELDIVAANKELILFVEVKYCIAGNFFVCTVRKYDVS